MLFRFISSDGAGLSYAFVGLRAKGNANQRRFRAIHQVATGGDVTSRATRSNSAFPTMLRGFRHREVKGNKSGRGAFVHVDSRRVVLHVPETIGRVGFFLEWLQRRFFRRPLRFLLYMSQHRTTSFFLRMGRRTGARSGRDYQCRYCFRARGCSPLRFGCVRPYFLPKALQVTRRSFYGARSSTKRLLRATPRTPTSRVSQDGFFPITVRYTTLLVYFFRVAPYFFFHGVSTFGTTTHSRRRPPRIPHGGELVPWVHLKASVSFFYRKFCRLLCVFRVAKYIGLFVQYRSFVNGEQQCTNEGRLGHVGMCTISSFRRPFRHVRDTFFVGGVVMDHWVVSGFLFLETNFR